MIRGRRSPRGWLAANTCRGLDTGCIRTAIHARAALLAALAPGPWWQALLRAVWELTGLRPNVDFALVALERETGLPAGSALAIVRRRPHGGLDRACAGAARGWAADPPEGDLCRPRYACLMSATGAPVS